MCESVSKTSSFSLSFIIAGCDILFNNELSSQTVNEVMFTIDFLLELYRVRSLLQLFFNVYFYIFLNLHRLFQKEF